MSVPAVPINAQSLIAQAIDKGADIATLERMVALGERMQLVQAKQAWVEAMTQAQQEFPPIEKTAEGKTASYSYKYAPLDTIDEKIKPVLHKHQLVMTWQYDSSRPGEVGANCRITHALGHFEDSGFLFVPIEPARSDGKGATPAQRAGIAATYARRYSCCAVGGIVPHGEDPDGKDPGGDATPEPAAVARDDGSVLVVDVKEIKGGKPGQKAWTKYTVHFDDGRSAGFFGSKAGMIEAVRAAQADKVLVIPIIEQEGRYTNLLSLTPAALVVPGGPVEDAQLGFDQDVAEGERDDLNAEVVRLGDTLKLKGPERATHWVTYCGNLGPDKVPVGALKDLVGFLKTRAGEPA